MIVTRILVHSPSSDTSKEKFQARLNRPLRGIRKVRILNFQAPNTSYNVHGINNALRIQTEDMFVHAFTLETGQYTFVELLNEIMRVFDFLGLSIFYNAKKYQLIVSADQPFRFLTSLNSITPMLGFTEENENFSRSHTSNQAPRMMSDPVIGINIAGLPCGVQIPHLQREATFIVPFQAEAGHVSFANYSDLEGQTIVYEQSGIDLNKLEVSLVQLFNNAPLKSFADVSFLLEFTSEE